MRLHFSYDHEEDIDIYHKGEKLTIRVKPHKKISFSGPMSFKITRKSYEARISNMVRVEDADVPDAGDSVREA